MSVFVYFAINVFYKDDEGVYKNVLALKRIMQK